MNKNIYTINIMKRKERRCSFTSAIDDKDLRIFAYFAKYQRCSGGSNK